MWSHTSISSKAPCVDWIEDFLKNRSKRIIVDGEGSEETTVTSGLECHRAVYWDQSSSWTFLNNTSDHVNFKCWLFADESDMKSNDDCDQHQQDLNCLYEWETLWGRSFNPSKSNIMHVTRIKETHTQSLYHQRPNPEYCWHIHIPYGRARIHLE